MMTTLQSSSSLPDALNAFCPGVSVYLPGAPGGPLYGLTFAAKDIFDLAGHITGGGNPHWRATHPPADAHAWAVQRMLDAGAALVGKTITDELTRGIFGENAHYGTPVNPRAPGRVPGGSSSGSASAVAGGRADFALGSDTGGSVRVPASYCGLYGLRPTHGRIPLAGMMPQAPTYDTAGWFARDAATFARVGAAMLPPSPHAPGRPRRLIIAADAFDLAEPATRSALLAQAQAVAAAGDFAAVVTERLSPAPGGLAEWSAHQQILQSREAWETIRHWLDAVNPALSFEVSDRYVTARAVTDAQVAAAQAGRKAVIARLNQIFGDGAAADQTTIDSAAADETTADGATVVCLPTTVGPAPPLGQAVSERHALRLRNAALTSVAGNTGRPQITLPLGEVAGLPVGLSLLGQHGGDESLIGLAAAITAG